MKKILKSSLVLLMALVMLAVSGCATAYTQEKGGEETKESALEAQPEINDPGDPVEYSVSGLFTDDMVLQRDKVINVWGKSNNVGSYVYGELLGETRYAQVDKNCEWKIQFSPKEYTTEGTTLKVWVKNGESHEFKNVLIGDVWIVSGQSNAESQGIGQIISGTVASHYTEVAFNVPLHLTFQAPLGDEAKIFAYGGPAVQLGLMSRTTYHGSISIGGIHYSEGDAVNHYNSENGTLNRFKALVGGGLGAQFGDLTFVLGYDYCLTNFSKVDGYTARRSQIRAGIHFGF